MEALRNTSNQDPHQPANHHPIANNQGNRGRGYRNRRNRRSNGAQAGHQAAVANQAPATSTPAQFSMSQAATPTSARAEPAFRVPPKTPSRTPDDTKTRLAALAALPPPTRTEALNAMAKLQSDIHAKRAQIEAKRDETLTRISEAYTKEKEQDREILKWLEYTGDKISLAVVPGGGQLWGRDALRGMNMALGHQTEAAKYRYEVEEARTVLEECSREENAALWEFNRALLGEVRKALTGGAPVEKTREGKAGRENGDVKKDEGEESGIGKPSDTTKTPDMGKHTAKNHKKKKNKAVKHAESQSSKT